MRQVIDCCREVTGKDIPVIEKARRLGDPPRLIAGSDKIRGQLGWEPRFQNIEAIIRSAWAWHLQYPDGYGD